MPAVFEAFALTWLATVGVIRLKASAYRQYESIVRRHLLPAFGDAPLEALTTERIQQYVADQIRAGLSPRTVRNHLEALGQITSFALTCAILSHDPCKGVVLPRQERAELAFLAPEGIRRVIECTPRSWRLLVAMAFLTGLRKGEQLALRFDDIDFERHTITVSKSVRNGVVTSCKSPSSVGTIPLPATLIPLLEERRRKVADPDGPIFCRRDGSYLPDGLPNAVLASALSAAGLAPMRWHDARASWCLAHLASGTDLATLQRLGRWKSPDTLLEFYTRHVPAAGGDAVRKMEELVK